LRQQGEPDPIVLEIPAIHAPDETVDSWIDLHERLFDVPVDPRVGRFRSGVVFRGVGNAAHAALITSLIRLGGDPREKERHLLRNFRKYAYPEAEPHGSVWYWLALGQHHGLPTRLLDWTFSPYVALHFATANVRRMETDALIWCVDVDATTAFLPPALAALQREEGAHVFTTELLDRAAATFEALERLAADEFVVFLEPPSLDARIVNQFALFSLMSSPTARLDEWLLRHAPTVRRIIIPARLKWEIRDKLDQANITERVLLPGLDGLSAWLRRYYYSKDAPHPPPIVSAASGAEDRG
jgi:hypothetical protein